MTSLPIRVLYTSHFSHLRMGGQKSMAALIEHLDRTRVRPFAVVPQPGELSIKLQSLDCPVYHLALDDVRRHYFWRPWKPEARAMYLASGAMRSLIHSLKIDLVHADEESDAVTCGLAAIGTKTKVIYHARVTGKCKLDRLIEPLVSRIVGVSDGVRHRFLPKTLRTKYETIFDGVDCVHFTPAIDKDWLRGQLHVPVEKRMMLFVGQVKAGKGIFDILEAMRLLRSYFSESEMPVLYVAGVPIEPEVGAEVERQIQSFGLQQSVQLLGQQPEVHKWIQAADLLLLPSHEGVEGLPRVLFEAMACGTVAVASDTTGTREVMTADTGFLVKEKSPQDLAALLRKILFDAPRLYTIGQAAVARARLHFDIHAHARLVESIYFKLLAGK